MAFQPSYRRSLSRTTAESDLASSLEHYYFIYIGLILKLLCFFVYLGAVVSPTSTPDSSFPSTYIATLNELSHRLGRVSPFATSKMSSGFPMVKIPFRERYEEVAKAAEQLSYTVIREDTVLRIELSTIQLFVEGGSALRAGEIDRFKVLFEPIRELAPEMKIHLQSSAWPAALERGSSLYRFLVDGELDGRRIAVHAQAIDRTDSSVTLELSEKRTAKGLEPTTSRVWR